MPTEPAARVKGKIKQPSRADALAMAHDTPWQFVDPAKAEPGVGGTGGGDQPLPAGWTPVESASRPGQYSYINDHTGEKIAWRPTEPASREAGHVPAPSVADVANYELRHQHETGLPEGWEAVPSASRPGEFSYTNKFTGEKARKQ